MTCKNRLIDFGVKHHEYLRKITRKAILLGIWLTNYVVSALSPALNLWRSTKWLSREKDFIHKMKVCFEGIKKKVKSPWKIIFQKRNYGKI